MAADAIPEQILVTAPRFELLGTATTSSQGIILKEELLEIPAYRAGQLLETVPGLVVTIHSGEGKANQYLLHGFNLDHGTDLATFIEGMPVNMRTHAHGQGYSDLNFFIPELAPGINYSIDYFLTNWNNFQLDTQSYAGGYSLAANGVKARSQGVELALDGELAAHWNYDLGYTYTKAEVAQDFAILDNLDDGMLPDAEASGIGKGPVGDLVHPHRAGCRTVYVEGPGVE